MAAIRGHRYHHHYTARHHDTHSTRTASRAAAQTAANARQRDQAPGSPYWSGARDDLFAYVFDPSDGANAFYSHGYGEIAAGAFPQSAGAAYASARRDRGDNDADQAKTATPPLTAACASADAKQDDSQNDDRLQVLTQKLNLSADQATALKPLQAAYTEAAKRIDTGCQNASTPAPVDQIKVIEDRLYVIWNAGLMVRTPFRTFYDTLNDEQKAQLNSDPVKVDACTAPDQTAGISPRAAAMRRAAARKNAQRQSKGQDGSRDGAAMLAQLSSDMNIFLANTCPQETQRTPLDRLDAANNRVNALIYVARTLELAVSHQQTAANESASGTTH